MPRLHGFGFKELVYGFSVNVAVWVILLLALPLASADAAIPATERAALIALYTNTDGDNWTDHSGWKTPPLADDGFSMPGTECTWHGVGCDMAAVTSLGFYSNELTGTIPAELGNLTNLTTLHLAGNQLTGTIPGSLGNLTNLTGLYLYINQLTGTIPAELGNLTNLRYLVLWNNQLTGTIPSSLGNLTNLTYLDLDYNQLTGTIPSSLGNLTNLTRLYLYNNQLSGSIPAELMNLTQLSYLNLCNNHLFTTNSDLRDFLDGLQPGWDECQTPLAMPWIPLLLLGE